MKRVLLAMGVLLFCQACGSGTEEVDQRMNTMTQQDAMNRVEDYVHRAVGVLPKEARLEAVSPLAADPCDDPTDNGPKGRVFATNNYWVRGLAKDKSREYLDSLVKWWRDNRFTGPLDSWDKAGFVVMENQDNGFRMRFQDGGSGLLSIGASSPCVWPNGKPT
ncbi:hypothetical protein ACFQ1S_09950 [Kibdelosporangium lantanae]|uniref:Lipoprotein n=1 Tax=Kibdelosporangium lantanae TaxID=1497396 RepID=A0ABW3M7G3_9PSEU